MNIYDFDKTIYDGDSSIDFFKYSIKHNKKIILLIPRIIIYIFLYLIKIVEKEKLKSVFFSYIKYLDNIDIFIEDFWNKHIHKIKKFYIENKKETDIVVSASPDFLLEPISEKLKFKLISTKVDKKTGKLLSKNCYGVEKVNRLKELNIYNCNEFYSDSLSDEPLAKISKEAFIIKNDELIKWKEYKENNIKKVFFNRDFTTFLFIGLINVLNGIFISLFYSIITKKVIYSYVLGFLTSLTISYILNTKLNFKEKLNLKKLIKFFINNIPNFIIQISSLLLFYRILDLPKIISYSISSIISVPITFILIKLFVYKNN